MKMRVACLFAVVLGVAFQTFGACGDNPINLLRLSNCGFDVDISGWTLVRGDLFVHHPIEGYSDPGAGYIEPTYYAILQRAEFELDSPCVQVANFTEYYFGAYVKAAVGAVTCGVFLFEYSDTTCGNWLSGIGGSPTTSYGDWVRMESQLTTSPITQSARIRFWCQDVSVFQALIDDAFIQNIPLDIFADGFESGDTTAWSNTVP